MIDEVDATFGLDVPKGHRALWDDLKVLKEGERFNSGVRVLLFAKYGDKVDTVGSGTTIEFSDKELIYFDTLSFSHDELADFANKWNHLTLSPTEPGLKMESFVELTPPVVEAIFTFTAGHVGLCRLIVQAIGERYLKSDRDIATVFPVSQSDLLSFLLSSELLTTVAKSRAVYVWDPADEPVVRRILMEGSLNQSLYEHLEPCFRRLKKSGLLADSGDLLVFSSPLLAMMAMRKLFRAEGAGVRPVKAYPFREFLYMALSGMSHTALSGSKVRSGLAVKTYEL